MRKQPLSGEKPEEGLGSWLFEFSLEESGLHAPRFCFGVCFSLCVIKCISLCVQSSWNGKLQVHSLLAWLAFSQKLECAVGMGAGTAGKRAQPAGINASAGRSRLAAPQSITATSGRLLLRREAGGGRMGCRRHTETGSTIFHLQDFM